MDLVKEPGNVRGCRDTVLKAALVDLRLDKVRACDSHLSQEGLLQDLSQME